MFINLTYTKVLIISLYPVTRFRNSVLARSFFSTKHEDMQDLTPILLMLTSSSKFDIREEEYHSKFEFSSTIVVFCLINSTNIF